MTYQIKREEIKERSRLWRQANYEQYRVYNAAWLADNPDKAEAMRKATDSRRRARKRGLPNTFTADSWQRCLVYWHSCCAVCGSTHGLAADHWIPLKRIDSPGTVAENMLVLCRHCNATKSARNPEEWLLEKLGYDDGWKKLSEIRAYFASVHVSDAELEE